MDFEKIQSFFFWCMVINIGIYLLSIAALLSMREFYANLLTKIFFLDEETIRKGMFTYVASYKLLIIIFNFVPWIAILIIK